MDVDKALATQLANIEKRSGRSLAELTALVQGCGLEKHGERVAMLKRDLGMGHGDANTLVHMVSRAAAPAATADDPLAAIYSGAKAGLRPLHEHLLAQLATFGEFEIAPKKAYVSLRRKKQFATVGPATKSEVEIGLNSKREDVGGGFARLPPGGMCQFRIRITSTADVDEAVLGALRQAFEDAG